LEYLKLRDVIIPFEERRSLQYRRITLTIQSDRVRVSAPKHLSARRIKEFLTNQQDWIYKHWLEHCALLNRTEKQYINGEQFLYRGNVLNLRIDKDTQHSIRVKLVGKTLVVLIPQDLPDDEYLANVRKSIITWYKLEARRVLKNKLEVQAKRMQVTYNDFRLKDQKTRWGSCSSQGNLNFNWRIIMAPNEVIDYLIIHELAHLTHLNHSHGFWERVEDFIPEYKSCKKWLKDHGQELIL
jgi:predicted metal-dependent hydrolase